MMFLRTIAAVTLAVTALFQGGLAHAQPVGTFFSGKTITLIIGGAAGGGYDAVGRLVARHMGRHIPGNPSMVVTNMSGAGSLVMMNHLQTKASHDGLVLGLPTTNVLLESKLKLMAATSGHVTFDVNRLSWIGTAAQEPQVLFVWSDTPFRTLADLREKRMVVGAVSAPTDTYILPTLMREVLGTNTVAIPGYKGSPEILAAMERREVDAHVALLANITAGNSSYLKDGKIRILLQFGTKRSQSLADIPTAAEYAENDADRQLFEFYGLKFQMSYPLVAPSGVSKERVEAIRLAFDMTMDDPEYRRDATRTGISLTPISGTDMERLLKEMEMVPDESLTRLRDLILKASKQ